MGDNRNSQRMYYLWLKIEELVDLDKIWWILTLEIEIRSSIFILLCNGSEPIVT